MNPLEDALNRLLNGDSSGHEDCGDGVCNVADSLGEEFPGKPLMNKMSTMFGGGENAGWVHTGFVLSMLDPSLPRLLQSVVQHEAGTLGNLMENDGAVAKEAIGRLRAAIDEAYPDGVPEVAAGIEVDPLA